MRLSNLEFIKLLPEFMRDDEAVKGLSAWLDRLIPELVDKFKTLPTWDSIDTMSEAELDDLAWELNLPWYKADAPIGTKRELIRSANDVHSTTGTKAAVENIIQTYFGDGKVLEWFEYGGQPGYFRVESTNPTVNNERMTEFLHLLSQVKRASSKLESIEINLSSRMVLAAGVALHEVSAERYLIGPRPLH